MVEHTEHTAKDRINRASRQQTRPAMEMSSLKLGMKVDIRFDPSNKDVKGWRGPATIATIQEKEHVVTVAIRAGAWTEDRRRFANT